MVQAGGASKALLFDEACYGHHLSLRSQKKASFFYEWMFASFQERLSCIKRSFRNILLIGNYDASFEKLVLGEGVLYDRVAPSHLEKIQKKYDLILAPLFLHHTNDVPKALFVLKSLLEEEGLLLGMCPGENTFSQLREACLLAESALYGGVSLRVSPMMTLYDLSALLERAGFALPVTDKETFVIDYERLDVFFKDMKALGETNCLFSRKKGLTHPIFLKEIEKHFLRQEGFFSFAIECLFYVAWNPNGKHTRPLCPGSGKVSLKDIL